MRQRAGSRPTPIQTDFESTSDYNQPIIPPLDPATERELRKSCSLLLLNPPKAKRNDSEARRPSVVAAAVIDDRERSHSALSGRTMSPTLPLSPLPPPSHPPRSATHTPPPNSAVFAVRKDANLRASQIEIRRVEQGSIVKTATIPDRASAFLLAKPTLVDVLPSPSRPRTACTVRSSMPPTPGGERRDSAVTLGRFSPAPTGRFSPAPRPKTGLGQHEHTASIERPKTGLSHERQTPSPPMTDRPKTGHGKTASGGSMPADRRLSLFPRPRTAHGSGSSSGSSINRPLPPLPKGMIVQESTGSPASGAASTQQKEKKKIGFVQFQSFWKATFRFGRSGKHAKEATTSVAIKP
ncbi:hypothetical protein BZA05DRAFT_416063 [Tricharina praecox]|uniref:uncharacterized protein n=1 Tax=Tricharina praecox TaxID=43433 RepID=UPI00221FAB2C|nr:uncharacterized protein BZA05DRAFT_416063 [Tricharina praecox]KAI5856371.1 hypothetical protein BZA05DRAFT_416063 [Tricharina praecox]